MTNITELSTTEANIQKIKSFEINGNNEIPFELVLGRQNKTTKLLANSDSVEPMQGQNRWYHYEFEQPVFLSKIDVSTENYSSFDKFEFKWTLADGTESQATHGRATKNDDHYVAEINQLLRKVSFRPPKKYVASPEITRIQLNGFPKSDLQNLVKLLTRLDEYKADVLSVTQKAIDNAKQANQTVLDAEHQINAYDAEITGKRNEIEKLISQSDKLFQKKQILEDEISKCKRDISSLNEESTSIGEKITERKAESGGLAQEIDERNRELRALQDDVNMFPTEISAFIQQGGQTIQTYLKLAAVPISLMVLVTGLLVFNAANLTTVFDEVEGAKIWSILLTRLPYVVIATVILAASYKLTLAMISEIIKINQQRLNLTKISIIATDTSNAAQKDLNDLSDAELYELRTDLKMQLLRDHLKEYLSSSFHYQVKSSKLLPQRLGKQNVPDKPQIDEPASEE